MKRKRLINCILRYLEFYAEQYEKPFDYGHTWICLAFKTYEELEKIAELLRI